MARIFSAGAELNTAAAGYEIGTTSGTAPTIESTITKNSKYSFKFNGSNAASYAQNDLFTSAQNGSLYYSFDFYAASIPGSNKTIFQANYVSGQQFWSLKFTSIAAKTLDLYNRAGSVVGTTSALSLNTWYRIEIFEEYRAAGSGYSRVTVRINGVEEIAAVVVGDATGNSTIQIRWGGVEGGIGQTVTYYFDNFRINDSSGSKNNSWCGEGYLKYITPKSTITAGIWDTSTGVGLISDFIDSTTPQTTEYIERNSSGSTTAAEVMNGASISSVSKANPGSVTTAGDHGLSTGDSVYIQGASGMTELNGNTYTVTVTGTNTFTIGVDTTAYGTYTSGGVAGDVTNLPITATINSVGIQYYCGSTSNTTGNRKATFQMRSASSGTLATISSDLNWSINGQGMNYDDDSTTMTGDRPGLVNYLVDTDPTTGVPWTVTGTNSIIASRVLVAPVTASTQIIRLYNLYTVVDWVPAAAVNEVRLLALLGCGV